VSDERSGDEVERLTEELERDLRREVPTVWRVFLDPTPRERQTEEPARGAA
jgi:hypothetical protein